MTSQKGKAKLIDSHCKFINAIYVFSGLPFVLHQYLHIDKIKSGAVLFKTPLH